MDLNDKDDIVTSGRQSVKEDDARYQKLKAFIQRILKRIQNQWTDLRTEIGEERALAEPIVKEWYETLRGDNKKYAKRLFGRLESFKISDQNARRELYKASLLAFEKLALNNTLSALNAIETEKDFDILQRFFDSIDEVEAVQYYQIVKGRLDIIRRFEDIVVPESKEKVLQQHIFDHLWLLDPSWERASSNFRVEQSVKKEFDAINAGLTKEEADGRIDIRYQTAAGKHIIIELKRYGRSVTATELIDQIRKYRSALEKCLRSQFPEEPRNIEAICILGDPPRPVEQESENVQLLRTINARYITYDTLIQQSLESYEDYLTGAQEISRIAQILDRLDDAFADTP